MEDLRKKIDEISQVSSLYGQDFFLSWEKSGSDIRSIFSIADILKSMRRNNISPRVFDSGIAAALIKNHSVQTRFTYASAANLLGLELVDLHNENFKNLHGINLEENANMISFLSDFIGIGDDVNTSEGYQYMQNIANVLDESYKTGILQQRPGIINLQCYKDYPTQSMADALFLRKLYDSPSELRKKKLVVTWAYSPNYDNLLAVPQSTITMMTRFGMHVELCHPEGYDLSPEAIKVAKRMAKYSGGTFNISHSMDDALKDADIVYPKSWIPYKVMEKHIELVKTADNKQLEQLKSNHLEDSLKYKDWEYNELKEKLTKDANALCMTSLPTYISGLSCKSGEISKGIFDKFKNTAFKQAAYKPYIIAAMMLAYKFEHPELILKDIFESQKNRVKINKQS